MKYAFVPFAVLVASCGGATSDSNDLLWPPPGGLGDHATDDKTGEPKPPEDPHPPELRLAHHVVPTMYRAELDLDPAKETFSGAIRINVAINEPADHVWLHANDLTIKSAKITVGDESWDLRQLDVDNDELLGLHFGRMVAAGEALIDIQYDGIVSTKETDGLFRQDDADNWYIFTQFEATSARKAFPCFDEPTFKVPWKLTLTVPKDHMAVSNTASAKVETKGDTKTVEFEKTKPLPSYLIAIAVGPFEAVNIPGGLGRDKVPGRIIVPKGHSSEAAYAVATTPKLIELLEDYFDMALPYPKMDSIAIPKFGGAMENPGLVTYSSRLLLAEAGNEPAWFKRAYAGVGAHELAHQWFGDLVTLEWWDDIWLNESFATWMAGKVIKQWKPDWDVEVRAVNETISAMKADSLATARKLRNPVVAHTDIGGVFDTISYQKGGAVLSMFEAWIGEEPFRDGVRAYMKKHAWGTTTSDDFLAALAGASRPEAADAFKTFLVQEGVPLVSATLTCEAAATPSIELSQERFLPTGSQGSADQTWSVPVCVKYQSGKTIETECTLLDKKSATLKLAKAAKCPTWVLPNADAAGYYRVAYADGMIEQLFKLGSKHMSVPERVSVIGDMSALVHAGKGDVGESLSLVAMLMADKSPHVIGAAVDVVTGVDDRLVPDDMRSNLARFIRKMFSKQAMRLGMTAKAGESDNEKFLRTTIIKLVAIDGRDKSLRTAATKLLVGWLDGKQTIDPDMMETIFTVGATGGNAALHERILAAAEKATDNNEKIALIAALAAFDDAALVTRNLELFLDGKFGLRDSGPLIQGPLARPESRQLAYDFIKDNFAAISEKLPIFAQAYLVYSAAAFCDQAHYDDAKAFFEPKVGDMPSGDKALKQTLEQIKLCMAFKDAQRPSVVEFLKEF